MKRRIAAGADQLAPYASRYPTVAILHNPGRIVDLRERFVVWAIDDLVKERGTVPISAVGVLESFRPNSPAQAKALRRQHMRDKFHGLSREEQLWSGVEFLQDLAKQYPPSFFDEQHVRLRIFHLPSPPRPLPSTAFVGPFDAQARLVPGSAGLKIVRMKKIWLRVVRGRL